MTINEIRMLKTIDLNIDRREGKLSPAAAELYRALMGKYVAEMSMPRTSPSRPRPAVPGMAAA